MDWHAHIHGDPYVLRSKPVVKGTRLSVEFLLDLLGAGWTEQQLLENYPQLSSEALRAVFAFAADRVRDDLLLTTGNATRNWMAGPR